MEYNFKLIGHRIRTERKKAGFKSQDALVDRLQSEGFATTRATLGKIENGKTSHYDCELLLLLCKIFNCEMGYLLGEYNCKTGRNTDISKATGLSEEAILRLNPLSSMNVNRDKSKILSLLIVHPKFSRLLDLLSCEPGDSMKGLHRDDVSVFYTDEEVINSALKDIIIKIGSDIRKQINRERRLTSEQLQEIESLFDKIDAETEND